MEERIMRFTGKKVVITGGSSGIGLATAQRIAAEGGQVLITGTNQRRLDEAVAGLPDGTIGIANDAGDAAAADALASAVGDSLGRVDGLFLNAGFGGFGANDDIKAADFDRMSDVNVRGPVLQLARLIPVLNEGGSVVVTASVSPYLGQAQAAVYAATKGAVTAIARSWAADLAGRNIRVNSIAPGPIATNFAEGLNLATSRAGFRESNPEAGAAAPLRHGRGGGGGCLLPAVGRCELRHRVQYMVDAA
jgi:NAD(P)-dependent dehydrogenase (short-subunit alcohol dehydrogenase family)